MESAEEGVFGACLDLKRSMNVYYEQRAPVYDDWYERHGRYDDPASNAHWNAELAALGRVVEGFGSGRLLDIACGTGRWTRLFLRRTQVEQVVGLDFSQAMLSQTAARAAAETPQLRLLRGDGYRLPFRDGAFDSVFAGFWLSHVAESQIEPFLTGVCRVARLGAALLIVDSMLTAGAERVQVQQRPLKDGSLHRVLKVYQDPPRLRAILERIGRGVEVTTTGQFFIVGRAVLA